MFINALLPALEAGYKGLWAIWDYGYRNRIFPIHQVESKVISVGNLTWGGTGKTPLVEYLARGLLERGRKLAVLSRGYGARPDRSQADEVRWLAERLEGIAVLARPDRVVSAREAQRQGVEVLLLDDGFQHRRLARQLDIVTVDATRPFGNRHLVPRGNLREPLKALERADWIILTRVDLANGNLEPAMREIHCYAPKAKIAKAIHAPVQLKREMGNGYPEMGSATWLEGKKIGALAAIGNPLAFQKTIENLGAEIVVSLFRRDHSSYDERDLEYLTDQQNQHHLDGWVTTTKDAMKLTPLRASQSRLNLWVLEIAFRFLEGEKELWQEIESLWS